jgi:hypothetical protein
VLDAAELAALDERIAARDVSLFEHVLSQTTEADRASLLALHESIRRAEFRYLEVGSHIGGSLQVVVRDPRCVEIVSIDPRPVTPGYPKNSTDRMMRALSVVPGADLSKLRTVEASTAELDPAEFNADFALIDGDHSDESALRDGKFALRTGAKLIAFHDRDLVPGAIDRFHGETGVEPQLMPDVVAAFAL